FSCDWSSDVCSSDLAARAALPAGDTAFKQCPLPPRFEPDRGTAPSQAPFALGISISLSEPVTSRSRWGVDRGSASGVAPIEAVRSAGRRVGERLYCL